MKKIILCFLFLGICATTFASNNLVSKKRSDGVFMATLVRESMKPISKVSYNPPCHITVMGGAVWFSVSAPTCSQARFKAMHLYQLLNPSQIYACVECAEPEGPNQIIFEMFEGQ